ncbi:hypothetical protein [Gordonia soli]|uniref:Uncharacterized protein n=1 Tax=Gordonia soli NBRC 108243 TaxID=1223545 RepID=M0QJZ5_9ACTN|nr:hypothetical protein [Gordonia soli]GAC68940.1 hypothetical protein GS4_20_00050 [Gordonia soli NBRC 108243]
MARVISPRTPLVDRRTVLQGGLVVATGVLGLSLTGCDSGPSAEQIAAEALLPLADAALADEETARTLGPTLPEYSAALGVVAEQRALHARSLREEITRLDQDVAARISAPASASPTASAPSDTNASPIDLDGFRTRLRANADAAGRVAVDLDGYRAGLTGSISASVTTLVEVQLA